MSMLDFLTEDLLIRILDRIGPDPDRKAWRLVCKEFLRVESVTRSSIRVLRIEFLLNLLERYSNIERLDLSVCPRIDDGTVTMLLRGRGSWSWSRRLRSLVLSRVTQLSHIGLEMLARACPGLEAVDVSHCSGFGDREAAALSLAAGLRELTMDKCLGVTDVGLARIALGCPNLHKLSIKWCMEIGDLGINLLCNKCTHLKFLDLSYLKVTNESLQSIASLPKLEVLALVRCLFVDDTGLQFLEHGCRMLQVINISRCESVSLSGLMHIIRGHVNLMQIHAGYCFPELSAPVLHWVEHLKNINTIRIDGTRVSDSLFKTLSTNCTSLIEIGLSKCIGVTNMGIVQLASGCVNLKIVDLTCCHSINDVAIAAIAESCGKLVSLKIESCDKITERSLDKVGSCCALLEELDLTECSGINDRGLEYLSRCSELLSLKLGLCTNISDKGLLYIASSCKKLQELDLYRCMGVGDEGLACIASGCKKLEKLNLSYCIEITDIGMKHVGYLKELCDLELRGLVNVTGVGLSAVAVGCKRLKDLDLKHCSSIDDLGFWALAYYSQNLRQINMSHCGVTDVGLCMVMGNLERLQDAKLVCLVNATVNGFERALRACCMRIKKVKLHSSLRRLLSLDIIQLMSARGCKFRWD